MRDESQTSRATIKPAKTFSEMEMILDRCASFLRPISPSTFANHSAFRITAPAALGSSSQDWRIFNTAQCLRSVRILRFGSIPPSTSSRAW